MADEVILLKLKDGPCLTIKANGVIVKQRREVQAILNDTQLTIEAVQNYFGETPTKET